MFKVICLFVLFINIHVFMFGQPTPDVIFSLRNDFGQSKPDSGTSVSKFRNGALTSGFFYDSTGTRTGVTLSFIDSTGNLNWVKQYLFSDINDFISVKVLSINDTTFFVCGGLKRNNADEWDSWFMKLNENGDSTYCQFNDDTSSNAVYRDMVKLNDSTILLLGDMNTSVSDLYCKIFMEKINIHGQYLQTYIGPNDLKYEDKLYLINNKIYVGGTRRTSSTSTFNNKIFINIYDLQLNYLSGWNPSTSVNEYFGSLCEMAGEIFMVYKATTVISPNPFPTDMIRIAKMNTNGSIADTIEIGYPYYNCSAGAALKITDSCMMVPYFNGFNDYTNELYFFDPNLNIICNTVLFPDPMVPDLPRIWTTILLDDFKIFGSGVFFAQNVGETQDHWNVLTKNIQVYLEKTCYRVGWSELVENNAEPSVYPNPANDYVKISGENITGYKIFDLSGKIITQHSFIEKMHLEINTSNLLSGYYFIQIFSNDSQICKTISIQK